MNRGLIMILLGAVTILMDDMAQALWIIGMVVWIADFMSKEDE